MLKKGDYDFFIMRMVYARLKCLVRWPYKGTYLEAESQSIGVRHHELLLQRLSWRLFDLLCASFFFRNNVADRFITVLHKKCTCLRLLCHCDFSLKGIMCWNWGLEYIKAENDYGYILVVASCSL